MLALLILGVSGLTRYVFSISGDAINNAKIAGYANTAEFGFRIEYVIESVLFLALPLLLYTCNLICTNYIVKYSKEFTRNIPYLSFGLFR